MSKENNFDNVQRRHSTVMAKYEWTSSLINMKKTGNEIHDRRMKSNRKANEFLQDILKRRSDGSLLDDNGIIDRYKKFLKYKTNFNDDDVLNEFDRRLRDLNKEPSRQINKNWKFDSSNNTQSLNSIDRTKSLSKSTLTTNVSSEGTQTNFVLNSDEYPPSSIEQTSSSSSSSSSSTHQTVHRPKARRADGTEIISISSRSRLRRASSDLMIFHHCHFPRSLKSRELIQTTHKIIEEEQQQEDSILSSTIEQYDNNQLINLLDHIDIQCSSNDFTTMLDQLKLTTIQIENSLSETNSKSNIENKENSFILPPNLFDQSCLSDDYYQMLNVIINDSNKISIYTMTIGIVQLSPSLIVPYSILNGRRPFLQCSNRTNFKRIQSKQVKQTCQVTAIESIINIESLQENDILLKINNQSVWDLTVDLVREMLQQTIHCQLTVARLCRPLI